MNIEKLLSKFEEGFKKINVKNESVQVVTEIKKDVPKQEQKETKEINKSNFDLTKPIQNIKESQNTNNNKPLIIQAVNKIDNMTNSDKQELKNNPVLITPINHIDNSINKITNRIESIKLTVKDNNISNITINLNENKNGIEIKFKEKPEDHILELLKNNGFKWSFKGFYWYAKQTEDRIKFAYSLLENSNNNNNNEQEYQEDSKLENVRLSDNRTQEENQADNIIDYSTSLIVSLQLNNTNYMYNSDYRMKLLEYIERHNIIVNEELLKFIPHEGLKNVLLDNNQILELESCYNNQLELSQEDQEIEPLQIIETKDQNIYINALVPKLNKNNTKEENDQEIEIKSYIKTYQIVTMIILSNEDYNVFCNNFLTDYDFLKGVRTNDQCICVMSKDKEPLIVDPSGHSYARYVCRLIEEVDQSISKGI